MVIPMRHRFCRISLQRSSPQLPRLVAVGLCWVHYCFLNQESYKRSATSPGKEEDHQLEYDLMFLYQEILRLIITFELLKHNLEILTLVVADASSSEEEAVSLTLMKLYPESSMSNSVSFRGSTGLPST